MAELAFNLFYFVRDEILQEIGAVGHPIDGNDAEMGPTIRSAVNSDLSRAFRLRLPVRFARISIEEFNVLERLGRQLEILSLRM
jgi:hypothetical protein